MQPPANELDSYIHTHTIVMDACYKKFKRAISNSTECFQNYSFLLLKQVSLHPDPGKAKTAVKTNNDKTMNSKSGVFQLKKLQLI